jgi:hypothetical protein
LPQLFRGARGAIAVFANFSEQVSGSGRGARLMN